MRNSIENLRVPSSFGLFETLERDKILREILRVYILMYENVLEAGNNS